MPQTALADGPVTPSATDYLARVTHTPAGIQAKPVDGYVQLWVRVDRGKTVVIKDFEGAPFLRFTSAGVFVNHNSEEYYLNQVPIPALIPKGITPRTRPRWVKASSADHFTWREGRLLALGTIALQPGQTFVGSWIIPVTVNGVAARISGGVWHRAAPSPVWFWPVFVMLACALAVWRVRDPNLDRRMAKALTLTLMGLFVVSIASRALHGRPDVDIAQLIPLVVAVVIVGAAAGREIARPVPGILVLLATAAAALWSGVTLIPVLTHGYVLIAFPPLIVRCVVAALLGGSLALFLVAVRFLGKLPLEPAQAGALSGTPTNDPPG